MSKSTAVRGVSMDVRVGETFTLDLSALPVDGASVQVTLDAKSGQVARLRIKADESVRIRRPDKQRESPH